MMVPGPDEDNRPHRELPEVASLHIPDDGRVCAAEMSLDALLARVSPENVHPEIDPGPGVGAEFW